MRIGVPRWIIVGLAGLFSAYVIVLGIYAIDVPISPFPAIAGMGLFAIVIALTLCGVSLGQLIERVHAVAATSSGMFVLFSNMSVW